MSGRGPPLTGQRSSRAERPPLSFTAGDVAAHSTCRTQEEPNKQLRPDWGAPALLGCEAAAQNVQSGAQLSPQLSPAPSDISHHFSELKSCLFVNWSTAHTHLLGSVEGEGNSTAGGLQVLMGHQWQEPAPENARGGWDPGAGPVQGWLCLEQTVEEVRLLLSGGQNTAQRG